ncbi:Hypothetical protein Ccan_04810 [Capnocytophaga canimorsus Cc5]|uniref:PA14 domain-containing protein n=2 Tax=Capnocytophaga canimorsus TaxID=28188 RepID=F9YS50_CAPCC|nr:hypothetical protein [Capnocytophaga canimorsus]ACF71461.1 hypothetical protein CAPCA_MM3 [Capnocytophaga canimorsus]AEK22603.1 Hypothetical protein Ccan_04810 [Capnocytophaga canimorsus Cc5]
MHHFKRVLFCVFFLSSVFGVGFSYAQCGGGTQVGNVVTPIWGQQNGDGVSIPNIKGLPFSPITYALINVVQGVEYEIYKIKAKDDTDKYLNFIKLCYGNQDVALSANVSSPNEYKISFKAPISGQLKLYVRYGEITNLHIRIIGGQNTIDTPRDSLPNENNKWRTYFYRETNNFVNYLGYKDYDNHWFHERRDPVTNSNPIEVRSQGAIRAGILRYFTARSVMRNTLLKGFYYVKLGADDGTLLFVNNKKVYDRWNPAGDYFVKTQVIKLTGNDKLKYEYFNDNIPLEYIFKIDPTTDKIIENTTLTSSNGTTLCMGESTTLGGDDFAAALPNTFTNPTFQWYYDTNPTGSNKQLIPRSNTRQYVVKANDFPKGGTFYFFREAKMIINNIGVPPKPESIISNPIKIDIIKQLSVSIDPPKELCQGTTNAQISIKINNGRGGTPPFTFHYKVGNTSLPPIQSNQNIFHIPVNTSEADTFKYKYLYVTDGNGCRVTLEGSDDITVMAPSITAPENVVWCLPEITRAVYDNNGNTTITQNSYVLPLGDTTLDVGVNSVPCCLNPTLKWTINNDLSKTRTGQPSTIGNISFENATSSDKVYTITYWLECNGQKYSHITRQVRITPRPQIHFSN